MSQKKRKKNKNKQREETILPSLKIVSSSRIASGIIASTLAKYTVYCIENEENEFTITRRYNDFKWLRGLLLICYPGLFVPPLPPPVFLGRFADSFIQKRRIELESFLLRLRSIEPFTKSDVYQCFMGCDDQTFATRKAELNAKPTTTNPSTATLLLQKLYPNLVHSMPETDVKQFRKLQKQLHSINEQMKVVDILGAKLHNQFNNISKDIPLYLNSLKALYSNEIKSGLFVDSTDTENKEHDNEAPILPKYTLFFMEFEKYINKIQQMFDGVFFMNLTVQHKDIIAFNEIFKQYDNNNKFYDRLCKSVERWQEMEKNNSAKNIELKPNQEKQKEADYNSKKDVFELLDMSRKIVLKESVIKFSKYKTKCWKEKINQFYTFQFALNQLTKHSNIGQLSHINSSLDMYIDEKNGGSSISAKHYLKKIQLLKDENKTLHLQNKQLRKQIKIVSRDADSLRNENIAISSNSVKQLQNIAIIKKEKEEKSDNNKVIDSDHQYDIFPSLRDIINRYENIKNNYLSKPSKNIAKDISKKFVNYGDQFIMKLVHEIMFDILFVSFQKMKEYEIDFYIKASKLFYIQNIEILQDLCKVQLRRTYLHIFDEIKLDFANYVLDIVLSSYSYSFSSESKSVFLQFIGECLRISWELTLFDGSLLLKPKTFDFEPRSKQIMFNAEIYSAFFGSHLKESLNYIIWPAIYDKMSNSPLSKISATFSKIIPKFNQSFINKKLKKIQQNQYDTIRIVAQPQGVKQLNTKWNESSIIKKILAKQESNLYKVYVGMNWGYKELSVGYVDNHNKKKFNTLFKKYPSLLLNHDNELQGIGTSAFDNLQQNEQSDNDYYAFDNFIIALCENKLIEIENKYDADVDNKEGVEVICDNNGKSVSIALLFDVTLHFFWNNTLDVIKKVYLDKFNEEIKEEEIEWKLSIPDMIYKFVKPLLKQSAIKLGVKDNLLIIKESQAIATNYNIKLHSKKENNNTKFMSVMLNEYCFMIGCYQMMNEYKTKELMEVKINKNISLNAITNRFVSLLGDVFGGKQEFDQLINSKTTKLNEIKSNFLRSVKSNQNGENDEIFDNIFGSVLESLFKEINKLLRIKQIEGCKQHIIICGELSEIECIQNKIRQKYKKNDKIKKIREENIHFAKSKISKGTALYDIVSEKGNNNLLRYRANKSWGISVQRDYIQGKDDKNKKIFDDINKTWNVNGVFYEIIKKGQMVQANHCEIIWIKPIHERKIQIDLYSSEHYISNQNKNVLYIDECEYEGSQSFELLSQWKNKDEIPIVFWCDVEENNKIRLHVCLNNLNEAQSRIIDLRWTVKK